MFILKLAMALWPVAALKAQHEEHEFELELEEQELWNHEEEIFQKVPREFFENHMERVVKLGPAADYKRLLI